MKFELAPSILSADMGAMRAYVSTLLDEGCERIHLDVMDGQFVPPITFGAEFSRAIFDPRGHFEAHLMTETPEKQFEAFADAGCRTILFHVEATKHSHRLLQQLRSMGVRAGIALNPGTPAEAIFPVLDLADQILVMTVNPGWGGQPLIESCFEKVAAIRERHATIDIEVDGGIDPVSLPRAVAAGANVFVSGSYIVKQNSVREAVQRLRASCL